MGDYSRQCGEVLRSMNIDDRPTTDLRANSHILQKFQTVITLQRVNRSPLCLVLGWGFRGRRIERRHFRFDQIQDGGRRPYWKINRPYIYLWNALPHSLYVCTQTLLCPRTNDCWRIW